MKPREKKGCRHIEEICEMVPKIQCKGLCHESCTSIAASRLEQKVVRNDTTSSCHRPSLAPS